MPLTTEELSPVMTSILGPIKWVLLVLMLAGGTIIVVWYVWRQRQFKHPVTIWSIRQNGRKVIRRLAAYREKRGVPYLVFKGQKGVYPVPSYDLADHSDRGGSHFTFVQYGPNQLYPVRAEIDEDFVLDEYGQKKKKPKTLGLTPKDIDMLAWNLHTKEIAAKQFSLLGFMEKYGSYLVLTLVIIGSLLIIYTLTDQLGGIVQAMNGIQQSNIEIAKYLSSSVKGAVSSATSNTTIPW